MFKNVLGVIMENERVEVYEKKSTVKASGSMSESWQKVGTILCNIQANSSYGQALQQANTGDNVVAVYNLYTRNRITTGQRIKRIEEDGLFYEIRNAEHNGRKTILEHYKAYLTRIDNQ